MESLYQPVHFNKIYGLMSSPPTLTQLTNPVTVCRQTFSFNSIVHELFSYIHPNFVNQAQISNVREINNVRLRMI